MGKEVRTIWVTVLQTWSIFGRTNSTSTAATKGNQVMRFIDADLHKKSITFCVVELVEGRTCVRHRQRISCREVDRLEELLRTQGPHQLVVEATIGYEWFAGLAERFAKRVVVAHSRQLTLRSIQRFDIRAVPTCDQQSCRRFSHGPFQIDVLHMQLGAAQPTIRNKSHINASMWAADSTM